jgi:hypothetical protein
MASPLAVIFRSFGAGGCGSIPLIIQRVRRVGAAFEHDRFRAVGLGLLGFVFDAGGYSLFGVSGGVRFGGACLVIAVLVSCLAIRAGLRSRSAWALDLGIMALVGASPAVIYVVVTLWMILGFPQI